MGSFSLINLFDSQNTSSRFEVIINKIGNIAKRIG